MARQKKAYTQFYKTPHTHTKLDLKTNLQNNTTSICKEHNRVQLNLQNYMSFYISVSPLLFVLREETKIHSDSTEFFNIIQEII